MMMNESKIKEEILGCLNESSKENVVSKKPEDNENPGRGEWTFADWFGEDLSGQIYKGSIDCSSSMLTSLNGSPKEVRGGFICSNNRLTSLKGGPKEVGGGFYCDGNALTSLEGAPEEVTRDFGCYNNRLTSLKGGPKEVGRDFYCDGNALTSLEGAPKEVGGSFRCVFNKLTSLKGAPEKVGGYFDCSFNSSLANLIGGPKEVGGSFYCNKLTSFKGKPEKIGGKFMCKLHKKEGSGQLNESGRKRIVNVKFEGYVLGGGKLATRKGERSDWPGKEETVEECLAGDYDEIFVYVPNGFKNLSKEDSAHIEKNIISPEWTMWENHTSAGREHFIWRKIGSMKDIRNAVKEASGWLDDLYIYCGNKNIDVVNHGDSLDDYSLLLHAEY